MPTAEPLAAGSSRGVPAVSGSGAAFVAAHALAWGWAGWVTTQVVAWRLGFHPNLGSGTWALRSNATAMLWWQSAAVALFTAGAVCLAYRGGPAANERTAASRPWRGLAPGAVALGVSTALVALGPLYAPWDVGRWWLAYGRLAAYRMLWWEAGAVCLTAGMLALCALAGLRSGRRASGGSTAFGSARWGDGAALRTPEGLLLARDVTTGAMFRFPREGHLLTLAPTGAGKGVSCVIPNLLTYPGAVVAIDTKGENAAVTARWRHTALAQQVAVLDPFAVVPRSEHAPRASFNPLDALDDASPDVLDDARLLADMLVQVDDAGPGAKGSHWNEEARALLTGLILLVATYGSNAGGRRGQQAQSGSELAALIGGRNLAEVRVLLTKPADEFGRLMKAMLACDAPGTGRLIARAASRQLQKAAEEGSGVVSTAQAHTHFLDSERMNTVLGTSSIDFSALKRGTLSVYLVLPPERLDGYSRWLRLMIGVAILALLRERGRPEHRVLFLLDEFQNLGRMAEVERHVSLIRGFGAQFWLFVQDVPRLKAIYEKSWGTFLANSDVLQVYGVNDLETARHVSELLGDSTVSVASDNRSRGVSSGREWLTSQRSRGAARTVSEKGRRLLFSDEVRGLERGEQLLFVRGSRPVRARALDYLRDPEFRVGGRAGGAPCFDVNPQYAPVGATAGSETAAAVRSRSRRRPRKEGA